MKLIFIKLGSEALNLQQEVICYQTMKGLIEHMSIYYFVFDFLSKFEENVNYIF